MLEVNIAEEDSWQELEEMYRDDIPFYKFEIVKVGNRAQVFHVCTIIKLVNDDDLQSWQHMR